MQHHAVKQCAVLYPGEGPYKGRIVAIVQSVNVPSQLSRHSRAAIATDPIFSLRSLTDFLACMLPSFMLPTVLIELVDMPYTPIMKIDRNRLQTWLLDANVCKASLGVISNISTALNGPSLSPEEHHAMALSALVADVVAAKGSAAWSSISGHDNSFVEIGINSAQIMRLASLIHKQFGTKLLVELLSSPGMTIRSLAAILVSSNGETKVDDENAASKLEARTKHLQDQVTKVSQSVISTSMDSTIPGRGLSSRHVFLTGATGYLGVQILIHLLRAIECESVTVLVRSTGANQALEKVRHALRTAGADKDQDHLQKLRAWPGDLSEAKLGLSEEHWEELSGGGLGIEGPSINAIIHCGALVNWTKSYNELEAANVTSTAILLEQVVASSHVR